MKLTERFRRLTLWNKIAVVGSIASFIGLALAVFAVLYPTPSVVVGYSNNDIERLAAALQARLSQHRLPSSTPTGADVRDSLPPASEAVLILFDTSGSMRLYPVQDAVLEFIGTLRRHDLVGVTVFSESTVQVVPLGDYPLRTLKEAVAKLRLEGRFTDLAQAVIAAAGALGRAPVAAKRLVVFTDGLHGPWPAREAERTEQFPELTNLRIEIVLFGREPLRNVATAMLPQGTRVWRWPRLR